MYYYLLLKIFSFFAKDEIVYTEIAESLPLPPPSFPEIEAYPHAFLKMFFSLIFFLAFLSFSLWFLKKIIQKRRAPVYSQRIKILEKRALSPKSILYLVEVEGKKMVLSESQLETRFFSLQEEKEEEDLFFSPEKASEETEEANLTT